MKNVDSIAQQAAADGLAPATYMKNILAELAPTLRQPSDRSVPIYKPELGRALLHESILYLFRSMSQLVSYEAAYSKRQFSWSAVTLYYSNYFSVLSMNRLAGAAVSTIANQGETYEVTADQAQSHFVIKKIHKNNHQLIWEKNYALYSDFSWHNQAYDGSIVKIQPGDRCRHYERKKREYLNYHPDSYRELFESGTKRKEISSLFGQSYMSNPTNLALLPFPDDWSGIIATLESSATARQLVILEILKKVFQQLQPNSRQVLVDYNKMFSKNIMSQAPFKSKLRMIFQNRIKEFLD